MRVFWVSLFLVAISLGDLLVYNGRHLEGANNLAQRFSAEASWHIKRALSVLRM